MLNQILDFVMQPLFSFGQSTFVLQLVRDRFFLFPYLQSPIFDLEICNGHAATGYPN